LTKSPNSLLRIIRIGSISVRDHVRILACEPALGSSITASCVTTRTPQAAASRLALAVLMWRMGKPAFISRAICPGK